LQLGGSPLPSPIEQILDSSSWYWAITGAHRGGGLDSTIILRKPGGDAVGGVPTTSAAAAFAERPAAVGSAALGSEVAEGSEGARRALSAERQEEEAALSAALAAVEFPSWFAGLSAHTSSLPLPLRLLQVGLLAACFAVGVRKLRGGRVEYVLNSWSLGEKQHG